MSASGGKADIAHANVGVAACPVACGALSPLRLVARFANRTFKSYRGASFRVVPCARWYAPCVMASLTGLLDQSAADNESKHDNNSEWGCSLQPPCARSALYYRSLRNASR